MFSEFGRIESFRALARKLSFLLTALCAKYSASQMVGCNSGRTYSVPSNVNCKEKNVVYAISCRICERVVYVGETERQLHERMGEHMRGVCLKKDKPINNHFFQMNHSHSDLRFTILEKMYSAGKIERFTSQA